LCVAALENLRVHEAALVGNLMRVSDRPVCLTVLLAQVMSHLLKYEAHAEPSWWCS
jgi:hypothetical protein